MAVSNLNRDPFRFRHGASPALRGRGVSDIAAGLADRPGDRTR